MKTFLAIVGGLVILGLVAVAIGGYMIYKKGSAPLAGMLEPQLERYIAAKHPPEAVASSLRRMLSAAKTHPNMNSLTLMSLAMATTQSGTVSDDQSKFLDEAAQLMEQGELSKEQLSDFLKKYKDAMPTKDFDPTQLMNAQQAPSN